MEVLSDESDTSRRRRDLTSVFPVLFYFFRYRSLLNLSLALAHDKDEQPPFSDLLSKQLVKFLQGMIRLNFRVENVFHLQFSSLLQ